MGKICWINGQPYLVSLPTGGKRDDSLDSQWDRMILFLGKQCNDIFHWHNMRSWCQDQYGPSYRVVRGFYSAGDWDIDEVNDRYSAIGFRPVLRPLDPDTLKPDASLLEDIPDGSRFALASLYLDGKLVDAPKKPTYEGDIANWVFGKEITFGDRHKNPRYWLHVIKHRDLLWLDRNILKTISWKDLAVQGFTGED